MLMRLVAVALLLPAILGLAAARRRPSGMAAAAFFLFWLDHLLMLASIQTGMRHAWILSPLRHNLHMWAVPLLLAVYWRELGDEVRRGQEQLQLVLQGSSEGFWDWDLRTRELVVSERGAALLGREAAPPGHRARAWRDLVHPDDQPRADEAGRSMVLHPDLPADLQVRMKAADGSWRWMEIRGRVVARTPAGLAARAAGTLRDVTEARQAADDQRELTARVVEGQKLESLGLLAGGVAHDFNNLLTIVRGNQAVALRDLPPGAARDAIQEAQTGARRATELTAQLLAYAGRGETRAESLQLARLAEETAALVRSSFPSGVRLSLQCPDALPPCHADATQMRQVLMNLLLNAAQAMQGRRGEVTVRAGVHEHSGDPLESGPFATPPEPGTYVWVEVADQGAGMDPETRARIFDPFFTTRNGGRGLGLAVVLGIVRGHRGAVTVQSEKDRGSAFRFYVPVAASQAGERTPAPLPIAPVVALRQRP
jgi:signal transduction histidine kinase